MARGRLQAKVVLVETKEQFDSDVLSQSYEKLTGVCMHDAVSTPSSACVTLYLRVLWVRIFRVQVLVASLQECEFTFCAYTHLVIDVYKKWSGTCDVIKPVFDWIFLNLEDAEQNVAFYAVG